MVPHRAAKAAEGFPPDLPGADLVMAGLAALRRGEFTIEALLVAVGAPRLRAAGLEIPEPDGKPESAELALYAALMAENGGGTHSRYNALIRRLVSFERALEAARRRETASHRRRADPARSGTGAVRKGAIAGQP